MYGLPLHGVSCFFNVYTTFMSCAHRLHIVCISPVFTSHVTAKLQPELFCLSKKKACISVLSRNTGFNNLSVLLKIDDIKKWLFYEVFKPSSWLFSKKHGRDFRTPHEKLILTCRKNKGYPYLTYYIISFRGLQVFFKKSVFSPVQLSMIVDTYPQKI